MASNTNTNTTAPQQRPTTENPPTLFQVDDTKLFVGNLPATVETSDLHKKFSNVGKVVEVYLMQAATLEVKCAFVRMQTSVEATQAISRFHHTKIQGRVIVVRLAKPCMC